MHEMTVNPVVRAAVAALTLGAHAAFADGATNELTEAKSSIELPSVEAGAFYRSMKIERGMVENKESVFGYEAEIEWYGFFIGIEACHDMTDANRRKGRYNEIESFAGYGLSLGDFSAKAAYVHKTRAGDEANTQELELELEYETPFLSPFFECSVDVDDCAGALSASAASGSWPNGQASARAAESVSATPSATARTSIPTVARFATCISGLNSNSSCVHM